MHVCCDCWRRFFVCVSVACFCGVFMFWWWWGEWVVVFLLVPGFFVVLFSFFSSWDLFKFYHFYPSLLFFYPYFHSLSSFIFIAAVTTKVVYISALRIISRKLTANTPLRGIRYVLKGWDIFWFVQHHLNSRSSSFV